MNVKRFTARTSREALALVRQAFGDDAVVMSTRPCSEGVEVLAMAQSSVELLERVGAQSEAVRAPVSAAAQAARGESARAEAARTAKALSEREAAARAMPSRSDSGRSDTGRNEVGRSERLRPEPARNHPRTRIDPPLDDGAAQDDGVSQDVEQLQMSTLSFQDYVRQRMLKRREAQQVAEAGIEPLRPAPSVVAPIAAARQRMGQRLDQRESQSAAALGTRELPVLRDEVELPSPPLAAAQVATRAAPVEASRAAPRASADAATAGASASSRSALPSSQHAAATTAAAAAAAATANAAAQVLAQRADQTEMMGELRSMRGLIEQRFGALAFMEKLQRQPRQAQLAQRLLDTGFSPALIRRLVDSLPADVDEQTWTAGVLERNLVTAERELPLEDQGGVYALIGATGVGKTTSTAKLAAAFATRHGATNLGLITLDAYRVAAHEQLRTYGRILGVPVHTAHDRASLEDLLELLAGKRLVLIDTAGMAQRDSRTRELLDMLSHRNVQRLLVINASAQGETIEDQLAAYGASACSGLILSKLDEAVKLGPAVDAMVRHKLKVVAVANGQRVPEDWHRLSANALVQRALKGGGTAAWKLDDNDVKLIFAGLPLARPAVGAAVHSSAI